GDETSTDRYAGPSGGDEHGVEIVGRQADVDHAVLPTAGCRRTYPASGTSLMTSTRRPSGPQTDCVARWPALSCGPTGSAGGATASRAEARWELTSAGAETMRIDQM